MTAYTVGSGQTLTGLIVGPSDSVTVAAGGTIVRTVDAGGIDTLHGGIGIDTTVFGGGRENVDAGGSARGSIIENNSSIIVTGNNFMSHAIIESGGNAYLSINDPSGSGNPTDSFTLINGGTESVGSFLGSGTALDDTVQDGGRQDVMAGLARGTIINSGGMQTVFAQAIGTVVNGGGLQQVTGGDGDFGRATGSVLNAGALQTIEHGSSQHTLINKGGRENVGGMGYADGTVINGGTLDLGQYGIALNSIQFTGRGGVLDIGSTATSTTTINGFVATDRIDLRGFGYSSKVSVSLGKDNVLTIKGLTGGTARLLLDPKASYAHKVFTLYQDGHGGTNLIVQAVPSSKLAVPDLANLHADATAAGDPLGLRATFTAAATAVASSVPASTRMMPDVTGGSTHAASTLAGAASAAHIPLLTDHHVGMG